MCAASEIEQQPESTNQPKCPACGSKKIRKISAADKIGMAFMLGERAILRIRKTFRCDDCGTEW